MALMKFFAPVSRSASGIESIASHGLTAAAPKPINSAKWCTSRASAVSMRSPVCRRMPSFTRRWCTALSASSAGMGSRARPRRDR